MPYDKRLLDIVIKHLLQTHKR